MITEESKNIILKLKENNQTNFDLINNNNLKILYELLESYNNYKILSIKKDKISKKFPNNKFIPENIYREIKFSQVIFIHWTLYGIHNKKININLYLYKNINNEKFNIDLLIKIISYILSLSENEKLINIYIYPSLKKKYIRKNTKHIKPSNVNSGSCKFIDDYEREIIIFRKEELIKVLIHECIHSIYLNQRIINTTINHKIFDKYNLISDSIDINESYTEIIARIINCYLLSQMDNNNNNNNNNNELINFYLMLSLENQFAQIQSNKIIKFCNHNKIQNIDKFTNTIAYYVITNIIFMNLLKFINILKKDFYLKNKLNLQNLIINNNHKNIKINYPYNSSMRMSLMECEIML